MLLNNRCLLPLFLGLSVLLSIDATAQIRFVQITDPHMFDEEKEATENKAALAACVRKINEEMAKGADYKFIVVTGDIGIENLVSVVKEKDGEKKRELKERREIEENIKNGAAELAYLMAPSKVRTWLFVPGNNDLVGEDITTLNFYQQFIEELKKNVRPWGMEVKDLCGTGHRGEEG